MSQPALDGILEWSPAGVRYLNATTRKVTPYATLAAAGAESGKRVWLALSRRSVFTKTVRLPNAGREEVRQLAMVQSAGLFPLPLADLAIDVQPLADVSPEGRLTLVAAMSSSELLRVLEEAKQAGFRVEQVVPAALGSAALAGDGAVAIVEATPEGVAIDVSVDGGLRLSRIAGEETDLHSEVLRTLAVAGATGGSTMTFGVPVAGAKLGDGSGLLGLLNLDAEATMDLEPVEVQNQRAQKRLASKRRFAALLAFAAVAMATLAYFDHSDAAAAVKKEDTRTKGAVNRLKTVQRAVEGDAVKAVKIKTTLDQAFAPAQSPGDVVTLVNNETPDGLWLTGLSVERGKPIQIRGTAVRSEAVAQYLERLGSTSRLRDVKLVFSNNATLEQTAVVQFSISAFPVGNLPLTETGTKRRP